MTRCRWNGVTILQLRNERVINDCNVLRRIQRDLDSAGARLHE